MDAEDLSQLSLFPATAEQVLEARKRGAVQWARGLPLDIILKVYDMLDMHECANDGKLITWCVLTLIDAAFLTVKSGFLHLETIPSPSTLNAPVKRGF